VLNTLFSNDDIHEIDYYSSIIKLRSAHYHLIPIKKDELNFWLSKAIVIEGRLNETLELKAIRLYLIKLKMSNSIQLPRDAQWILDITKEISLSLVSLWKLDLNEADKIARSNWLYDILDYRGWAPFHGVEAGEHLAVNGMALKIHSLLSSSADNVRLNVNYWNWLEEHVFNDLKLSEPVVYKQIVEFSKKAVSRHLQDESLWSCDRGEVE
jgi:hypothetical protein